MRITSLSIEPDLTISRHTHIVTPITEYLRGCDGDIFEVWKQSFPSTKDVSIAGALNKTVFPKLEDLIQRGGRGRWFLEFGFKHRSYSGQLFIEVIRRAKVDGGQCLLITQTDGFKRKFKYNSSTMTIDSLVSDFRGFCEVFDMTVIPRITFLIFEDLDLEASIYHYKGRQILKLEKKTG